MGLELRPRRMREAAALWASLTESRGVEARDALWAHPDLLPDASDLENPEGFLTGTSELADFSDLSQLGWNEENTRSTSAEADSDSDETPGDDEGDSPPEDGDEGTSPPKDGDKQ